MTQKDYIRLANALSWAFDTAMSCGVQQGTALAIRNIMHACKEDNAKFDAGKFVTYLERHSNYDHKKATDALDHMS